MQTAPSPKPMTQDAAWLIARREAWAALSAGQAIEQAADIMRTVFFKLLGYEEPQEESES